MKKKEYYTKIADYLILNGYSKDSSGLYYGKAGIALGLFELSRYLQDEKVEDHAFEILNQSLLSKIKLCNLEVGLAGIAYALRYLIENKFIEADSSELFGDKLDMIAAFVEEDSTEWQEKMNKMYALLYAFSNEELLIRQACREKASTMWHENTEGLLRDFSLILKADSPLTQELHRRFLNWIQWIKQIERRNVFIYMNNRLFSETIKTYQTVRNEGLLIDSPPIEYFLASPIMISDKDTWISSTAKSTQARIIDLFCIHPDSKIQDFVFIKGETEENLQQAFTGNKHCSSLKEGIVQLLLYQIALNIPQERERLSELILLPDLRSLNRMIK